MGGSHGGNDVEARQRASGGDGGAPEAGQVIAIGMGDFFDQSEDVEALELSRHGRWGDMQVRQQIGATPAMNVEFAKLQNSQKRLLGSIEEVQALDARIGTCLLYTSVVC